MQGAGPYAATIKKLEADIVDEMKKVNELIGVSVCVALTQPFQEILSFLVGPRPDSAATTLTSSHRTRWGSTE